MEKLEDWHAGRSLKKTDERLDALEAKVEALNSDFAKTCSNMQEVSEMMDKKIADLKDFVSLTCITLSALAIQSYYKNFVAQIYKLFNANSCWY